jgi:hypothetical protein
MSNYLLLRDNKQSGPHTFDELKEKGLKAYDLVWVEGKSAAWRYPCEIPELSPFAPQVEEQPFDRFYKKPAQSANGQSSGDARTQAEIEPESPLQNNTNTSVTPAPVKTIPNGAIAATILTGDPSSSSAPGKRIIYVTLPAGKTAPVSAPAARETKEAITAGQYPVKTPQPVREPAAMPTPVGDAVDIPSHNSDDRRETVELTPHILARSRSTGPGQTLVMGVTVLALLLAGIFIGMSLNKNSPANPKNKSAVTNLPAVAASPGKASAANDTVVSKPPVITASISLTTASVPTHKSLISREKSSNIPQKAPIISPAAKDSALLTMPVAHREATHRSDITTDNVDKDAVRNNLSNLISLGASKYDVGTFGGISGLQLTVSNRSTYSLDLVVVEVQYIQANKKVFKTENLYFRGIAPGSALMQEAPKSSRGIKVQYKITLVNSKELGLSYSAL